MLKDLPRPAKAGFATRNGPPPDMTTGKRKAPSGARIVHGFEAKL